MKKRSFIWIGAVVTLLAALSFGCADACTSFGAITNKGSIIGKNRDFLYSPQSFQKMEPLKQFVSWYDNPYGHSAEFYALIANSDVKFGVNSYGLTAIEEDPPFPKDSSSQRKYMQPYIGYSEGMILYGILQNFTTVAEVVPYIKDIFSTAAPNFYQIADANSILNVEVAYGQSNADPLRHYTYSIIARKGQYFTHTNTYLNADFESLNALSSNYDGIKGSNNRLKRITEYINNAGGNFNQAFSWYLDTASNISNDKDKNYCFNTSILRSNLQGLDTVTAVTKSDHVYGTVSSFMVEHNAHTTLVHVRIFDSINTLANGDQHISYKELSMPLDKLFVARQLPYSMKSFSRKAADNGVCR